MDKHLIDYINILMVGNAITKGEQLLLAAKNRAVDLSAQINDYQDATSMLEEFKRFVVEYET